MKFSDFLAQQNEKVQKEGAFDASAHIVKYQALISELYNKIDTEWLGEYVKSGQVKTGECTCSITEERLGTYQVQSKWIEIAGQRISIQPVGTILIGTDARLDIGYQGKERMIIHCDNLWKLVDRRHRITYKVLDAKVFQNLLMDLMK